MASDNDDRKKRKSSLNVVFKELAPYLDLGLRMALTVGLMALLGWWLDTQFDTKPLLLIICSLFGIAAAFVNFFRTISRQEKKKKGK